MFSHHLAKMDHSPAKTLLLIAAGLVIVCQLVAMMIVAAGQVEKAQTREAEMASARAATAWCLESNHGAALKDCARSSPAASAQAGMDEASPTPRGVSLATLGNRY